MDVEEAVLLLEHTGYDDFNLLEHQIKGRLEAIQVILKENQELKKQFEVGEQQYNDLVEGKEKLKEQLDYLRSGEYLNQLKFERDMLQNVVDNSEVSTEDKEFIDMTHRNTQLLKHQKEFIEWLEENWKTTQDIWYIKILNKYRSIIGCDKSE